MIKNWTQASDGLVKLQAIALALENSLAKNQTHLRIITDSLAIDNDLAVSSSQ